MAQYPLAVTNPTRLVTKADTASTVSLGAATVTSDAASSGTYGSWAQIVAATSAESYITGLGFSIPTTNTPIISDAPITIQLGTGAGGSEVVKYEDIVPLTSFTARHSYLIRIDVPFRVTASKRVAARIKTSTTTIVDLSVTMYGLPISQTEGN